MQIVFSASLNVVQEMLQVVWAVRRNSSISMAGSDVMYAAEGRWMLFGAV